MTYRDQLLALALQWKFGGEAEAVLALVPAERRPVSEAGVSDPAARLAELARRESRRVNRWGRRRWGGAWDRLDPRVRAQLVRQHGRDH